MHARLVDVTFRKLVYTWHQKNNGLTRFYAGGDQQMHDITTDVPTYDSCGDLLELGSFGGDSEFVAAADILGCVLFTYARELSGDARR